MKSIPRLVWLVPTILLLVATLHFLYGYYTFTRIVIFGTAAVLVFIGFRDRPAVQVWSVPVLIIGVLFNPFVSIHLHRQIWFYLDIAAAAVFVAHLLFVRWRYTALPN